MDEYSEIIKEHPYFVLISEKPATWHGFLPVNNNKKKMEVKLIVPNYPSMKNSVIRFGRHISLMHDTDFSTKSLELLHSAISVSSFLRQLQRLMDNYMKIKQNDSTKNVQVFNNNLLDELTSVLKILDVAILGNNDLTAIKLTYKNISIILKQTALAQNPWTIVSSDLPTLSAWQPLENCISSLAEGAKILKTRTDALEEVWDDLKYIDEYCWVIDPIIPKPSHLYRRIYLNPSLSLLITMNPFDSTAIQDMKLLGSDNEVGKYKNIMMENMLNWNENLTIVENLQQLLCLDELPSRPIEDEEKDDEAIVDDNECCICFSLELDDGEMPDVICNNQKCRRQFHTCCLYQWLESVAGNQTVFDVLYGTCPNCKEAISCPVVKNKQQ